MQPCNHIIPCGRRDLPIFCHLSRFFIGRAHGFGQELVDRHPTIAQHIDNLCFHLACGLHARGELRHLVGRHAGTCGDVIIDREQRLHYALIALKGDHQRLGSLCELVEIANAVGCQKLDIRGESGNVFTTAEVFRKS